MGSQTLGMPGRHLPPDPDQGDANTIGGYMAVHARPAAFEGPDGMSYSVSLEADATGDPVRPWGAFLLFVRWRRIGEQGAEGHLETGYLEFGDSAPEALALLGSWPLSSVRSELDQLVRGQEQARNPRKWWDVMRTEDTE